MLVTSKVSYETDILKSLPIGISDFAQIQSQYYYVDKTLMIKEFLDQKSMITLFTRPHGFGKTLNLDMLRVFFEISETDTSKYFADTNIWKCGESYRSHQGKYPVIFLTFKDTNCGSWPATLSKIQNFYKLNPGGILRFLMVIILLNMKRIISQEFFLANQVK